MEAEEYDRNVAQGEFIRYIDISNLHVTTEYPYLCNNATQNDMENMSLMEQCQKNEKVLLRGYKIREQMNRDQNQEYNHDGCMNVSLSQDSSNMFLMDNFFEKATRGTKR